MYCPPKKFVPACWHLSSVLLASVVCLRHAQVVALHNFNVFPTWGWADIFCMLCTFEIILHVACYVLWKWFFLHNFNVWGWVQAGGHSLVLDPSGSWDHKKVLRSNPNGVQVKLPPLKLWQWAWLGGAHGLSGWVCCFLPSIYTHMLFFHL
jgi:hypothetical protein